MSVTFADSFKSYGSTNMLAEVWGRNDIRTQYVVEPQNGALLANNAYYSDDSYPCAKINPQDIFRISFEIDDVSSLSQFYLLTAGPGDFEHIWNKPTAPIQIEATGGALTYRYRVFRYSTTSSSSSSVLFESEEVALVANTKYRIEVEIDHRTPDATAKIYVNGQLAIDAAYQRDVIGSRTEFPTQQIGWFGFPGRYGRVSKIVVWDDDGAGLSSFPVGPLDIDYIAVQQPDMSSLPADDATSFTVNSDTFEEFNFDDVDPLSEYNAILAEVRTSAAGGTEATQLYAQYDIGGQTINMSEEITPGLSVTSKVMRLINNVSGVDLNAAVIKLKRGSDS